MYSDERSQGLAPEQPVLYYENSQDQRQERMRQLANVFIDMYLKSRPVEQDVSIHWVN
jgi:hypothetical protein